MIQQLLFNKQSAESTKINIWQNQLKQISGGIDSQRN